MNLGRIFFFILVVLSLSVIAADDVSRLDAAKKALQSGDEIEQFRGYNECKTIYLRANLNKNTDLARDALSGIVKGGEALGIDVTKYKAELTKLQPAPIVAAAPVVKPVETAQKPLIFPKEYLKAPAAQPKEAGSTFLAPTSAQLFDLKEPIKASAEFPLVKQHRLLDAKWKNTGLELLFDTPIDAKEIRLSKIIESDKQRFRYIIDIDSGKLPFEKSLEHKNVDKLRLGQYDSKTLRLVIEHSQAIAVKPVASGSSVFIDLSFQALAKESSTKPIPAAQAPALDLPPLPPLLGAFPPSIMTLPPLTNVTPRDRSKKVIVIDPGHGGKDSGAIGNGYMEKNIVLDISLELSEQLKAMGYTVHMTRSSDVFIELKDRTKFANDKMADLFLSIHANAIPKGADANAAYGLETYYLSPGRSERAMRVAALENSEDMGEMGAFGKLSFLNVLNTEKIIASNKLAIDIQKGVLNNLRKQFPNVKDNGAREAPFWVLVGAQMPAILLETGYISNPDESARIADGKYQKWMVEGMIDGIKHYFANNP
ncbi:MAG: N-acetylmuramoyl-L-alanine amidase [Campylobacterota bacterium]|nr:N-acetylmuramoyl-L-alanine amidase [Campylobacterota bacterium]